MRRAGGTGSRWDTGARGCGLGWRCMSANPLAKTVAVW
jgi:hypothetical protein